MLTWYRKAEIRWTVGRHDVIPECSAVCGSPLDHSFDCLKLPPLKWIMFAFVVVVIGVIGGKELRRAHITASRPGISCSDGRLTPSCCAEVERSSRADGRDESRRLRDLVNPEPHRIAAFPVVVVNPPDGSRHRPIAIGRLWRRESGSTQYELVGHVNTDVELDVEVVGDDGDTSAVARSGDGVGAHLTTGKRRPEAASRDLDEIEETEENRTGRTTTTDVALDAFC